MRKKKIRFVILSLTLFIMSTVLSGCKHNIHKPIVLPDDFEVSEKSTPGKKAATRTSSDHRPKDINVFRMFHF